MAFEFQPLSGLSPEDNALILNSLSNNLFGFWSGLAEEGIQDWLPDLSPNLNESQPNLVPHISEIPARRVRRQRDPQRIKEASNQRSRAYRKRKKKTIEELVRSINGLILENQKLKRENGEMREASRQLLEENTTQRQELANLSSEAEIEDTVSRLDSAVSWNQDEAQISSLLERLHEQQRRAQIVKSQEFVDLMSPKLQTKLVVLDKTPKDISKSEYCHSTWTGYLTDAGVSEQQLLSLRVIRRCYLESLSSLLAEREQLRNSIKQMYIQNITECTAEPTPIVSDRQSALDLSHQLTRLRANLDAELKLQETSFYSLSRILTSKQFAVLTLKQHEFRQRHKHAREMLDNIWAAVGESTPSAHCNRNTISSVLEDE